MRSKILTCITSAIILAWMATAVRLSAQQAEGADDVRYRAFNLGTLGGTSSSGNTINNLGWSMGIANLAGNATAHATVWIYGLKSDLGTLGGPNSAVLWPVKNDRAEIAGVAETSELDRLGEAWSCSAFFPSTTYHVCRGFIWRWGSMTALPTLGGDNGFAAGENNQGQIAGWAENNVHDPTCAGHQVLQFEPVVYGPGPGQIRQLPNFPGDPDGAATAINERGETVGISGTCDVAVGAFSAKHALLWRDGTVTDLGNLGGKGWNTPMAINNRGQIVGFSDLAGDVSGGVLNANFHAFLWTRESGMKDLGTLPGDSLSEALDINDRGQIVGVSYPSTHAFLWEHGKMWDLNKFVHSGSSLLLLSAGGINERGEITGQACVIADGGCPNGKDTPAFFAIPHRTDGDWDDDAAGADAATATVPDSMRDRVMRTVLFGHSSSEKVTVNQ